jgi:hypothetical protein
MIYVDSSGAISPIEKEGFYPVHEGTKPTLQPCTTAVPDRLQWHEDGYWVQLWKLQPLPLYSAGEWLSLHGVGSQNQPTLMYLRMKLDAANKTSAKLDQLEEYLQGVLAQYAADDSPRCDWGLPPVSYKEAVKEAMEVLQS